ncbi:conjugal transfer mating pair stabilization protein TraG [Pantoea sp. DY-15]|uniref:conjugal transfer mating-pair stabilization protein TraG n=1 Tax=Pantoea sp. DY-15 TaxID=2871489 RepID=UPI001C93AF7C|nr:conjugal transfer mating-pair stabilization protein TraG [Pantoea sp. DY-15]MBY4890588.1 conjugal transfer mating pair stabilization protein TraG [Pantoea sp. DY-15]
MDTIYTVTGGSWFRGSLNAVAAFFQTEDWASILKMAATMSVMVAAMTYVRGKDLLTFVKWAGALVLITSILVSVKRPVQIIDLSQPTVVYQVDNVPVGIAMPFSLITSVGHALVVGYEAIFHQPDAMAYGKTGMLFGAHLMGRSTDFLSTNPQITGMFSDYVQNCVVGDILLNQKYTLHELMNASDPYALIFSSPSPLRGIYDEQGDFRTCQWAAAQLHRVITTDTNPGGITYAYYVRQIFGHRADAAPLFGELLGNSYGYFYAAGQSASDIMKKNVTLNALRKGIPSFASRSGDTASLVNLSAETSYAKLRMSQATSADIATKTLPIMQTVLTGVLIGLFPIVIAMATISALTLEVLKGYVYTIAYLQSWPLLFAILNDAMNHYLQAQTSNLPVTLSNLSLVQQQYSDIGTTAGWLALSIPFLAAGIVIGLHKVMSQAGSYLGSALQSASAQSSSQAVDGTWAFNNMQTDNVQGHKWDTNSSFASGQMITQVGSGATKTITGDGNTVYNTAPAMSKLATDINFSKTASSAAQRLARESDVQAENALQGYNQSVNSGYNLARQYSQQHGNSATMSSTADDSQTTSESQAINQMLSASKSYAQRNNISESQAWGELHSKGSNIRGVIGAGMSIGMDSSKSVLGKAGQLLTGASAKGDVHLRLDRTADNGASDTTSNGMASNRDHTADHNSQDAMDFKQGMDQIQAYRTSHSGNFSENTANSELEQIGATLSKADSQYQQYTSSRGRSHEYSEMASASEILSANTQSNYSQEFVDYVERQRPNDAERILTNTQNGSNRREREELANQFMEEKLRARVEGDFTQQRLSLGENMIGISKPYDTDALYELGQEEIESRSRNENIRDDNINRVVESVRSSNNKTDLIKEKITANSSKLKHDSLLQRDAYIKSNEKFKSTNDTANASVNSFGRDELGVSERSKIKSDSKED